MSIAKVSCLIAIVAICVPSSMYAQAVTYNYADQVNFSEFRTYQWVAIEGATATDPALDAEIRAAIDTQLTARGITRSDDGARLLIGYQVSLEREVGIAMLAEHWQYGPGWSWAPWYGYSRGLVIDDPSTLSTENGMTIRFGHLVLDAYDATYHDLVWRGRVTKAITFGEDSPKQRRQLNKAVAKLIKAFPHGPTE